MGVLWLIQNYTHTTVLPNTEFKLSFCLFVFSLYSNYFMNHIMLLVIAFSSIPFLPFLIYWELI